MMPAVVRCAPRRLSSFVASHASAGLVHRAAAAPRAICLSQTASTWTSAAPLLRDGAANFRSPPSLPAVRGAAASRMTASTPSPPRADGEPTDPVGEGDPATDGDTVLVHYVGCLDDGTVFDSSRTRGEPLTFTIGAGSVIPGFDAGVRGLRPGGKRTTRIEADQAYGRRNEELLIKVPLESCPDGLKAGDVVRLSNGATATVDSVAEGVATIDANHRLAGLALTFEMELMGYQQLLLGPPPAGQERFVGAAGCFWGTFWSADEVGDEGEEDGASLSRQEQFAVLAMWGISSEVCLTPAALDLCALPVSVFRPVCLTALTMHLPRAFFPWIPSRRC